MSANKAGRGATIRLLEVPLDFYKFVSYFASHFDLSDFTLKNFDHASLHVQWQYSGPLCDGQVHRHVVLSNHRSQLFHHSFHGSANSRPFYRRPSDKTTEPEEGFSSR